MHSLRSTPFHADCPAQEDKECGVDRFVNTHFDDLVPIRNNEVRLCPHVAHNLHSVQD